MHRIRKKRLGSTKARVPKQVIDRKDSMANILVVDDDPVTLKVVEQTLAKAGHAVTTAKDGHGALEICARELFELIITDANMPGGISGFSLAATLRKEEKFKTVPIMFLTGRREKHDVMHAVSSGADDYVVKPIDPDMFLAKISALLQVKDSNHGFSKTPVREPAMLSLDLEIVGVSEQGVSFVSPSQLALNSKINLITELWDKLGIASPQLRIVTCGPADSAKSWVLNASFIGLTETEHKAIRQWVMSNSPLKSKRSS